MNRGWARLWLVGLLAILVAAAIGTSRDAAAGSTVSGLTYSPLTSPTRVYDTRPGSGRPGAGRPLYPYSYVTLPMTGPGLAPGAAAAVVLNLTVTGGSGAGFLRVFPTGTSLPEVSNLNWTPGSTVANLATVRLGSGGQINVYKSNGSVELVVDLEGYYAPGSGPGGAYFPIQPYRLHDTRLTDPLGPGGTLAVRVSGAVPSGVAAVALEVTATGTTADSFLTVTPQPPACPTAGCASTSNLNWVGGHVAGNRVITPLGSNNGSPGWLFLYNYFGQADVVIDVIGWYAGAQSPSTGSTFTSADPCRIWDHQSITDPNQPLQPRFSGVCGIPSRVSAVTVNVTASETAGSGWLGLSPLVPVPYAAGRPEAPDCNPFAAWVAANRVSDLNWQPGQVVANLAQPASNPAGGAILAIGAAGSLNLTLDSEGWFTAAGPTDHLICITGEGSSVSAAVYDRANGAFVAGDPVIFSAEPAPGTSGCSDTDLTTVSAVTNSAGTASTGLRAPPAQICLVSARDASGSAASVRLIPQLLTVTAVRTGDIVTGTAVQLRADGGRKAGAAITWTAVVDSMSGAFLASGTCVTDASGQCRFNYFSRIGATSINSLISVTDAPGLTASVRVP